MNQGLKFYDFLQAAALGPLPATRRPRAQSPPLATGMYGAPPRGEEILALAQMHLISTPGYCFAPRFIFKRLICNTLQYILRRWPLRPGAGDPQPQPGPGIAPKAISAHALALQFATCPPCARGARKATLNT